MATATFPCAVSWCSALSGVPGGYCAVHTADKNYRPCGCANANEVECKWCEGSGKCAECDGDGECSHCSRECGECDGSGECAECGGAGLVDRKRATA